MSFSDSLVPRPRTIIKSPVAFGSNVPQWPTFLMPNLRRIASTTSCDVGPAGLSMRIAPSSAENSCITVSVTNSDRDVSFRFRLRLKTQSPTFQNSTFLKTIWLLFHHRCNLKTLWLSQMCRPTLQSWQRMATHCNCYALQESWYRRKQPVGKIVRLAYYIEK